MTLSLSIATRSLMPLSVAFIFSMWFIPMSHSQSLPIRSLTDQNLLGCDLQLTPANIRALGTTGEATSSGMLPQKLLNETLNVFEPGDNLFTRLLPLVQLLQWKIVCSSRSAYSSGYSSLSVLITYTCAGLPCTRIIYNEEVAIARTYSHIFSLFCVGGNTWRMQDDPLVEDIGYGGNYTRSHDNDLLDPEIAMERTCSVCTTDPRDAAKLAPEYYNPNTGCVSCPSSCGSSNGTGGGHCLTAVQDSRDIESTCCRYVLVPGSECISICDHPYYSIVESHLFDRCQQNALLVREGVKKQYCANDVITYTCSSLFLELGEEASLMWDMDLGEDENSTIDVGYSDTSRIGITSEYNNFNIHTALTDYNLGEYLASTLKVIVNSDTNTFTIEVRCTVGNLLPVVDILQAAFLREEPRPPSGFRIINQEYISVNATLVTLAWDPPPGQTVDYYILVIDPDTRTKTDYLFESPITVELKPYRFHAATLIAANCIGESTSAALEVVTIGPEVLIINEDKHEITVTNLDVVANSGEVAPSLLCVASSLSTSLVWDKVGGFPFGITVSNGLALFGHAIKLDWEKKVHFTDSGTYTCTSIVNGVTTVMEIYLTVLHPPSITSFFPNIPTVRQVASNTYEVPVGFDGVIFTCNAIGWPPADAVWLSDDNSAQPMNESGIDLEFSGYSSVELQFPGGTSVTDSGTYTCFVSSESTTVTHSVIINLKVLIGIVPRYSDPQCPVEPATVFFQLQVQHTDCLNWTEDTREKVVIETGDSVVGGILSQCEECMITGDTIIAIRESQCSASPSSRGVMLFSGEITTIDATITSSILCGLQAWHKTVPLVLIDSELLPIAPDCRLKVKFESVANPSFCKVIGLSNSAALVAALMFILFVLILILVGVTVGFFVIRQMGLLPTVLEKIGKYLPTRVMTILDQLIPKSVKEAAAGPGNWKHRDTIETMYEDAIFPDGYNPITQEFNPYTSVHRRSMYGDDVETVYLDAMSNAG